MKKFTRTGKKALSVFLAALMVMTAWVFVAPTKAEAIDGGKYYVEIRWRVSNEGGALPNEYKGTSTLKYDSEDNCAGISLFYKRDNGTGKEEEVYWDVGREEKTCGGASGATVEKPTAYIDDKTETDYYARATIPGFPTKIFSIIDYNKATRGGIKIYEIKVGSSKSDLQTIWKGTISVLSNINPHYVTLNSDYTNECKGGWPGEAKCSTDDDGKKWEYPYAKSIVWGGAPSTVITPIDSSTVERTVYSHCIDQYNVRLATEPTYSFACTGDTISKTGITGSKTTGAANSTYKISITKNALLSTKGQNKRTVTITAKYTFNGKTVQTPTKSFAVNDPTYKITYNKNDGGAGALDLIPASYNVHYGESLDSQKTYDNNKATYPTSGTWMGHTFIGMFDNPKGGNPMDTSTVVTADKTYYAHWEINKYVAVFWNRKGTEVVYVENDIDYGEDISAAGEIAASKLPSEYDELNHYKFVGWNTALTSITQNQPNILPNYSAERHTFTSSTVEANCAHGAGTEYKCACGYSYVVETSDPTTNHQFGDAVTVTKDPTCTAKGEGYYTCTVCGAHSDTVTVPATGHTYKIEKKDATCIAEGYIKYTCSKGDDTHTETLPKIAHVMVEGTKHAATCGSAGYTEMHCQNCNTVNYNKYTDAATGKHNWTINSTVSHNSVTVNGECSVCHATFTKTVDTTHELTGVQSQTAATCQTEGKVVLKCAVSGCTETHEITLDKNPNAHTGYTSTVTDATCTATGTVTTKCTACGVTVATATIPAKGHSFDSSEVTKEATCTESGVRTYTCSKCGATKTETIAKLEHKFVETPATCLKDGSKKCALCGYTETITSKGHQLGNWESLKAATCKDNGIEVQKCTVCGQIQNVRSTAKLTNHSFSDWTTYQAATCTSDKIEQCICSVCGKTETRTVTGTKGHTWNTEATVDVEPSCISAGSQSIHCSACDARTYVESIDALGHNYQLKSKTDATCKEAGVEEYECSRCHDVNTTVTQPTGHNFVETDHVAATCGDAGHVTMKCACGESYIKYTAPATGKHTWDYKTEQLSHDQIKVTATCSSCKKSFETTVSSTHAFGNIKTADYKPATCIKKGSITINCGVDGCTESHVITIPESAGTHTKISSSETKKATCTEDGKVEVECDDCTDVIATVTIPAKGHDYSGNYKEYVASTCTTQGHITYECKNGCGTDKTEDLPADSNAHNFVKGSELHAATCTMPAYYVYTCANGCGKTYNEYTGNANGHKWTIGSTSQNGTQLTITCKCSVCGETHDETVTVAEGHNYKTVTASTPATCTKEGSITIACDKQHDSSCTAVITVAVPVDSTAHDYEFNYTAPTCKAEGLVSVICKNCGERLHDDIVIAKLEHSWNDGEVTTKADCDTNGVKTYTCTVDGCGATKTEVIPMTGHKWNGGVHKDATCTMGGYTHFTCTVCDKTYDVIDEGASAAGHKWNDGEIKTTATCTADGEKLYTCTVEGCGATKTEVIPALGHDLKATEEVVAPTCTTSGYTVYKCSRCDDYTFNVIDSSKPATGHSYTWTYDHASKTVTGTCSKGDSTVTYTISDDGTEHSFTVESYTAPKCDADGSLVLKCTKPGCTKTETIVLAHDGTEHNYETVITFGTNCEDKGAAVTKCTYCGNVKETVEIPANGHNYGDPVYNAATCTSKAYNEFTCEKCGDKKVVFVEDSEPTGHHFTQTDSTATCTKAGTITVSCEACKIEETVSVPALGHDFSVETEDKKASTCNEVGYTVYKCSHDNCEETKKVYSDKLADHDWGAWKTEQEQTDVLPKIEVNQCKVCGVYDYKYTAPAGSHVYDEGVITKSATCTEEGENTFTCIGDHCTCTEGNRASYTTKIPATGHTVVTVSAVDATCTTAGKTARVYCDKCDKVYLESKTVAALGHRYEVKSVENATCKDAAKVTLECTVCHDETTVSKGTVGNHSYTERSAENDISATCTTDGYEAWKCATCDDIKYVKSTTTTATGHKVDETKTKTVPATCKEPGLIEKYCSCGQLLEAKAIAPDATKHAFDKTVTVAAKDGCLESGYSYTVCSVCGAVKEDSITVDGAKDHEYEYKVDTPATCAEAGSAHFECKTCKSKLPAIELPKLQHTYGEGVETKKATCQAEGEVTFTCTKCDDTLTAKTSKTPHDYEAGEIVPATCSKSSYQVYKCKNENCDATYNVIVEGPLATHNYVSTSTEETCLKDGTYKYECSDCHANYEYTVPATGHNFTKLVESESKDSTCKEVGYKKYQCANDGCDAETTVYEGKLADHQFSDWEVVTEATTDKAGLKIRTCSVCGLAEKETISPIGNHKFVEDTASDSHKDATCTEDGYQKYVCTIHENCSANYTEVIPATGHTSVTDKAVPATCISEGKTAGSHCSVCDAVIVAQQTIPAKNHNYSNTPIDYTAATCRKDGSVTLECTDCEAEMTVTIEKNPDAHKMVIDTEHSQEATCKQAAYTAYKCDNEGCTYTYKQWTSDPTAHSESAEWTTKEEATCASAGYKVRTCTVCGVILETEVIPANSDNHTYSKVTVDGTHFKSGYTYDLCEVCGKIDNIEVSETAKHSYDKLVEKVDPTAHEDGYAIYECECGDRIEVILPKEGCDYDKEVTKQPTCTEKGETTYTCKIHPDEEPIVKADIPALGHDGKLEVKPASCTEDGYAKIVCARDGCGEELSRVTIDKIPHTFNDEHKEVVESTCQTNGSITYTCTAEGCNETFVVSLSKLPHDYANVSSVDPTCLDSGYDVYKCKYCDSNYHVVSHSANGHRYNLVKKEDATCSTNGHVYYECANCTDAKYDYEIPATGNHNYAEVVTVDPKCEAAGYTYNKCKDCDAVDKDSVKAINPLGHNYTDKVDDETMRCSRCDKTITIQKSVTDEDGVVHALVATVTRESTCTVHGEVVYICQNHKDCEQNITEELPLADHAAKAESIEKVEPTCNNDGTTVDGYVLIKCASCGAEIEKITIAASHSYKIKKVEKATCASMGEVTEVCEKCGHERITSLEINASAHDYDMSNPVQVIKETCETDGYTVYQCTHCDAQKIVKTSEKLAHKNVKVDTVAASCKADGYIRTTCADCGKIIDEEVLPMTEHTEVIETNPATCTKAGSKTTKCAKCGEIISVEVIDPIGHKWGEWVYSETVSCTTGGTAKRKCTVCGEEETKTTPKGEHTYDEGVVTPPTCTEQGYTTYTCTKCGHSYVANYTPMTDHNYSGDFVVVIEPTCHSTGSKVQKCIYCGDINPDSAEHNYNNIPRLNHNYGDWKIVEDATCDRNGLRQRTCQNEGCPEGYEGHVQKEIISKIGHNYGEWTVIKQANCSSTGEKVRTCDRCGGTETEVIEKGHHKIVVDNAVEATCTSTGLTAGNHCEICGEILVAQKVIPMKSHVDFDGNGRCDTCDSVTYEPSHNDTCLCHGTGFRAFLYKIVLIFWKIFRVRQTCVCGAKHW